MITSYGSLLKCYTENDALAKIETNNMVGYGANKRITATFRDIQDYYWNSADLAELIEAILQARAVLIEKEKAMGLVVGGGVNVPVSEDMDMEESP